MLEGGMKGGRERDRERGREGERERGREKERWKTGVHIEGRHQKVSER